MAFFDVDLWNPKNMASHSTDEKSRDQWVKKRSGVCEGGVVYEFKK